MWTWSGHAILFGLSPTPTVAVVQNFWGYRSLLKNPLILQKFGSTRDTGIAFKGTSDPQKRFSYHFMFGNGSGTRSDVGEEKKIYLSLVARPAGGLIIETYGDWETRDDAGRFTGQGFVGYGRERFRAGAHFVRQTRRRQGLDGEDLNLEFLSLFGVGMLAEKVWAVARFDRTFDPNPNAAEIDYIPFAPATRVASNLLLVGLDFVLAKGVRLMPNAEVVIFDEPNVDEKPETVVMPRLTVFYDF